MYIVFLLGIVEVFQIELSVRESVRPSVILWNLEVLTHLKMKKVNLRVCFIPLRIAVFWAFENDNILSSKSYAVTKNEISPQRKLGSLRNLKLKFIRH